MDPEVWGSAGWRVLHRMAYYFRRRPREEAVAFYSSLETVLPCPSCQAHFAAHLTALPFPPRAASFGKWMWAIHHRVNVMKKKALTDEPSYGRVVRLYKDTPMHPDEWVFIHAVVRMHPGKRRASAHFLENLATFLRFWCDASGLGPAPEVGDRTALRTWVEAHAAPRESSFMSECKDTCARR
jgi:hypothetical protein